MEARDWRWLTVGECFVYLGNELVGLLYALKNL